MDTEEFLGTLEAHRDDLRRLGVRRIGLFGSAARGEATAASDLDFRVEFERKSFDAHMNLKFFLEDLFGRRVDLVLKDSVKPRLREAIAREAVYASGS